MDLIPPNQQVVPPCFFFGTSGIFRPQRKQYIADQQPPLPLSNNPFIERSSKHGNWRKKILGVIFHRGGPAPSLVLAPPLAASEELAGRAGTEGSGGSVVELDLQALGLHGGATAPLALAPRHPPRRGAWVDRGCPKTRCAAGADHPPPPLQNPVF